MPVVLHFEINGERYRLVLGERPGPEVHLEKLDGQDALGVERWRDVYLSVLFMDGEGDIDAVSLFECFDGIARAALALTRKAGDQ